MYKKIDIDKVEDYFGKYLLMMERSYEAELRSKWDWDPPKAFN